MTIERPDPRETAERAYGLWESRGRPEGSPEVDWFEAERRLRVDLDAVATPVVTFEPLAQEAGAALLDEPGEQADNEAVAAATVAAYVSEAAHETKRSRRKSRH